MIRGGWQSDSAIKGSATVCQPDVRKNVQSHVENRIGIGCKLNEWVSANVATPARGVATFIGTK